MNLMRLTIGQRLGLGFGAVALIALLLGVLAVFGVRTLGASIELIGGNRIPALLALAELNRERMVIRSQTLAVFMHETQADAREGLRAIQEGRQKSWQKIDKAWDAFLNTPRTSERGRALQDQLKEQYQAWRAIYVKLDDLIERLASNADPDRKTALYAEYRTVVNPMVPISDRMGQTFNAISDNNMANTTSRIEQDRSLVGRLETLAIMATVIGVLLAALLGWLITRSVVHPLKQSGENLKAIAEGDMTQEVPAELSARPDELGDLARAMRDMAMKLKTIVGEVAQATTQVSSAAAEIAQGSADLSQRTEQQASALEETASSMEELTSTVRQSADNAGQANQLAGAARAQAEQG